jgi:protein TonB
VLVRGPTQGEILALVPPAARAARQAGRASVNCEIQLDTRLDACRLADESPAGFGFGQAALAIAPRYFRFRPPMTGAGQAVAGARVTVFVEFGRQPGRR